MRIVCQKCSAAYAIDDKFVTPKGVRAQCPRCRHMQLVKKDEAGAAAAPPPAPAAPPKPAGGELHFGQTAPAPQAAQGPAPFAFDFAPPPFPGGPASAPDPAPESASSPFDFSAVAPAAPHPFDFGSPPPGSGAAAPAGGPAPFDFGSSPPAAAPPSPFDFGGPPPAAAPAAPPSPFDFGSPAPAAAAPPSPFDFGGRPPAAAPAAPSSPFDFGPQPPAPVAPPAASPSRAPVFRAPAPAAAAGGGLDSLLGLPGGAASEVVGVKCRTCGKEITDPFDQALGVCDDCRAKVSGGAEATPAEAPAAPARPFVPAGSSTGSGDVSQVRSATRAGGGRSKGQLIGLGVGAVVLAAVVIGLVAKRPWAGRAPLLVTQPGGAGPARPVDAIIQQWRLKYPDIGEQTARALVEEGEESLAKDTTASYADAEDAFQQALVLEPANDRALAGWVLSLAFGRAGQIDEASAKAAESMMGIAEQRGGDVRVFVAHAHFLIARGGPPNDVKVLAERALNSKNPNDRALASLAVGQTLLTKNPELADRSFKDALSIDPKLKRSYFFLAQLAVTQGRYKDANDALEKRLQLDADQWEAAEGLARLAVDVGEVPRAKKVLEDAKAAAPRSGRPRLGLAMLAYQHQGDYAGATEQLSALVNDPEATRADRADALVHLATIQRIQGDAAKAAESLETALELAPDSVPAKLQRLLVYIERNVTSSARMEFDGLKGKLGDKSLEAVLEGRLQLAESRLEEAMKTLGAVAEADPSRVEALLLAGAVAAKARKDGKAWEFCLKKGLRADPGSRAVPSVTHLYVRPADVLRPAVGAYAGLVADLDDDPNPSLCEGLVAWYSEDLAAADKHFARVTNIDPKAADANALRALVALRRRDVGGALKLAGRAVGASRTSPLGYYAQALAQLAANKPDLAKVSASNALKFGPQLLGPRVVMGDVDGARGDAAEARRLLTSVLLADPHYRDAKRVLFKHAL
jgi:predicted Zn finger-like uncharacterized protein